MAPLLVGLLGAPALGADQVDDARAVEGRGGRPFVVDSGLRSHWECRTLVGGNVGPFANGRTWETVGRDFGLTASAVFALTCEVGGPRVSPFFGAQFAPWFLHRNWSGNIEPEMITASLGATTGSEWLRLGGLVTVGEGLFGAGLRAVWLPIRNAGGARRGVELRATLWPEAPVTAQFALLFTVASNRVERLKAKKRDEE